MKNDATMLLTALKEMIGYCKTLHQLLKADSDHFIGFETTALEENNNKKTIVINQLAALHQRVNAVFPQGLVEAAKQHPNMSNLVEQLETEINDCYHCIKVNSSTVYANLTTLKEVWDRLIASKSESLTYDQSGNIGKPVEA